MLCFQVLINGNKVCTAGVGDNGVISTTLTWVKVPVEELIDSESEWRTGEPALNIGGLHKDEFLFWLDKTLAIGDEVLIKIIESDEIDKPIKSYHEDTEKQKEQRRKFYEELKREFESE